MQHIQYTHRYLRTNSTYVLYGAGTTEPWVTGVASAKSALELSAKVTNAHDLLIPGFWRVVRLTTAPNCLKMDAIGSSTVSADTVISMVSNDSGIPPTQTVFVLSGAAETDSDCGSPALSPSGGTPSSAVAAGWLTA